MKRVPVPLPKAFPYRAPTWPGTLERPPARSRLGAQFDTDWARSPAARASRALILDGVIRPTVKIMADPQIHGLDRIDGLESPAIFVANHASHLDTPLLLASLPYRFRHRTVVAAAADYFFDTTVKAHLNALSIAAFPVDRTTISRRSLELATALLEDGWNLIIFPEGGRTPDGWAREFRGGAAFLARRCAVPLVPVHLEGTRRILRKGRGLAGVRRSTAHVTFGRPIRPDDFDTKGLTAAIEHAVAVLADEQGSDWWTARRRAAKQSTPALGGPEASPWRRAWSLPEGRRRSDGVRWPA